MYLGLVDLDTGNLASLESAIRKLNINYKICKNKFDFEKVDKIILPGVGAFKDFMQKLNNTGIDRIIKDRILKNIPLLGVCVGFQVLFSDSNEYGKSKGLNILKGNILNFQDLKNTIKVPHVGWNECKIKQKNELFYNIDDSSDFYFTHSYLVQNCDDEITLSTTEYEIDFISSIKKKNIYGVQFHPEKSQSNGLKVLKNFHERC
tara:strand:+ start:670 stop:1284 length:615 start_codon:yes stop_codon:yes gene_type:complete